MEYDVIIIGAGAAGLMAAASSAVSGNRTLVLEKNSKLGVKILMSGGTRCNLTHNCDAKGVIDAFGPNGKFLFSALASLSPADVVRVIESLGVATKVEASGKVFPVSNKAVDVRDALVSQARSNGAELVSGCAVSGITLENGRFRVVSEQGSFQARAVVVTTGGRSYPGCGTTGDGYGWAAQMGHTLVEPYPALTPILSACSWANELQGVTLDPVRVAVVHAGKPKKQKAVAEQTGSFLFTHWGVSGPVILDISREVARHKDRRNFELVCDFLPGESEPRLEERWKNLRKCDGAQQVGKMLPEKFPRRFREAILSECGVDPNTRIAEISGSSSRRMVEQIKQCRLPVQGTLGFEKAEVTSGGIALSEVDSKTMMSKRVPGLFLAGEILDLDGRIGGFNFQAAFSTGWLAGEWSAKFANP